MASIEDDMTPEGFRAAFESGEPVEVTGSPRVHLEVAAREIPGGLLLSDTRLSFGSVVVNAPPVGAHYSPEVDPISASRSFAPA